MIKQIKQQHGAFSHQHPVLLSLIQFAFKAGGDECPQGREKALHHQVRQDLQGKQDTKIHCIYMFNSD